MRKVIIGGTHSGCGKTTVTCALLQALKSRKLRTVSFKCGPDYIDPMFHEKIIGTLSHNLDSFFCDDDTLKYLLVNNSEEADISIIEGVMGFYDGANGRGSAYSVSEITQTPAIIVVDCKGMSDSLGAVLKGFLSYRKNNISGFIFNRLPQKLTGLAQQICEELGTEYFGYMPLHKEIIESRHLGLVTADEITDIKEKMKRLGELAEKYILIDKIIEKSESVKPSYSYNKPERVKNAPVIAVAKDKAFCFIYRDNISFLESVGCRIKYFSPLDDEKIPEDACGLILSGGYPELYADKLSKNKSMLSDIYKRINDGIPTIAECGGFMYLHRSIEDKSGNVFSMAGVLDARAYPLDRLQRFGYVTLYAKKDCLICNEGENLKAHEFHYWDSSMCGEDFTARKSDGRSWECVNVSDSLYAGFPHIYYYSASDKIIGFVKKCALYGGRYEESI